MAGLTEALDDDFEAPRASGTLAAARQLAKLGARITIVARSESKAQKLVADLKAQS